MTDKVPMIPLGLASPFTTGSTPPTSRSEYFGEGYQWANISDLGPKTISETAKSITQAGYEAANFGPMAQPGDLLFSFKLSVGTVSIAAAPMLTNEAIATFPSGSMLNNRYAYYMLPIYLLRSANFNIYGAPLLNDSIMRRAKVPVPSLETQRRIADYLDRETGEIDAMIVKLGELTKQLEHLGTQTTAVFGLDDRREFHEQDVNSPLAGIPDHWDRSKFGYEFTESTELNGNDPPGPLLSISEYRGVELNTRSDGQQASLDVSKYRVVRPGQLAANMMWLNHGGLGVSELTGYISPDYKAFWISDRFEPRYVHYLFRSKRYIQYFGTIATGVRPNAQRVTKTSLDLMPIPVPPLDEQRRIADHLDDVTSKIDAMLAKVAELKNLLTERRAALITDVVTGRKDVA